MTTGQAEHEVSKGLAKRVAEALFGAEARVAARLGGSGTSQTVQGSVGIEPAPRMV